MWVPRQASLKPDPALTLVNYSSYSHNRIPAVSGSCDARVCQHTQSGANLGELALGLGRMSYRMIIM